MGSNTLHEFGEPNIKSAQTKKLFDPMCWSINNFEIGKPLGNG